MLQEGTAISLVRWASNLSFAAGSVDVVIPMRYVSGDNPKCISDVGDNVGGGLNLSTASNSVQHTKINLAVSTSSTIISYEVVPLLFRVVEIIVDRAGAIATCTTSGY